MYGMGGMDDSNNSVPTSSFSVSTNISPSQAEAKMELKKYFYKSIYRSNLLYGGGNIIQI